MQMINQSEYRGVSVYMLFHALFWNTRAAEKLMALLRCVGCEIVLTPRKQSARFWKACAVLNNKEQKNDLPLLTDEQPADPEPLPVAVVGPSKTGSSFLAYVINQPSDEVAV